MGETPNIDRGASSDLDTDSDGLMAGVPVSGKQAALLLAVVAVVGLLVWRARSGATTSGRAEEIEDALEDELDDVTVSDEGDEIEIEVPVEPSDELQKDEAVLEALKANGKMSAGD